jgi:hypothetical protein
MTPACRCALLVMTVLLAGCQLRSDVSVDVAADGSGTFAVTLSADQELRRVAREAGADPLDELVRATAGLRGWEVSQERAPERDPTVTLRTRFDDPADLQTVTTQFSSGLAAAEIAPLAPLRLALTDDTVTLEGSADLRVREAVGELGLTRSQARRALGDSLRLRISAHMPGRVIQTNADRRPDDRTVEWTIAAGQQRTLRVQAARPWTLARLARMLFTPWGLLALLLGAALILAGRYAFARSALIRSRSLRT